MRERYPEIDRLVLTVNRHNAAAISTYLKAGFRDTGRMYHGGASGPQHAFALPLDAKFARAAGTPQSIPRTLDRWFGRRARQSGKSTAPDGAGVAATVL